VQGFDSATPLMTDIPPLAARRVSTIELRNRLERLAIQQFEDACGQGQLGLDNKIRDRLAFVLVTCRNNADLAELHGLVRLARHVYARTSDVLHGRSGMVNIPDVVLAEWTTAVENLEAVVAAQTI
jgi:hypothetical protein